MPLVYAYDHHHDGSFDELRQLVGGKAAGLNAMAVTLGLPVPPAFVITTAACNQFLASGWPDGLEDEIRVSMARLEAIVGRRFGDPSDPLLVSVRSGAPISMPGMMETILNLGLNEATEAGLAAASGDPEFASDCRARFEAQYRDVVGVTVVPTDPWEQLRRAIEAVFRSWNGEKAKTYRAHEGISEALGTGVTVQAMVFGNLDDESGTGVLLTRNAATGENVPYGDVVFKGQGEDVVSGAHGTLRIADLAERMPEIAAALFEHADRLERHFRDARDIEFTIERRRLWLLQDRTAKRTDAAALRMAVEMAEDPSFPVTREEAVRRVAKILSNPPRRIVQGGGPGAALTRGLGVSPGLVCGEIALTSEAAVAAADTGRHVILVRAETSPSDVGGMERACGILTSTGGNASHAAVVARGWNTPAVVGASEVIADPAAGTAKIAGHVLPAGALISIDGSTGEVFEGRASGVEEIVPEARVLLGWARELGIPIGGDADAPAPGAGPTAYGPSAGRDDLLRVLAVKGYADASDAAIALGSSAEVATTLLDALVADALAEPGQGKVRLTEPGREAGHALLRADSEAWGVENASAALDEFGSLNHRLKVLATSWQVKASGVPNDHADAAYDAEVCARVAPFHDDVRAWLAPLVAALPRLARYGARLDAAAAAIAAGNGKFIGNPRVDSYHNVWFELHEDLIILAGRNRKDETAAGRA